MKPEQGTADAGARQGHITWAAASRASQFMLARGGSWPERVRIYMTYRRHPVPMHKGGEQTTNQPHGRLIILGRTTVSYFRPIPEVGDSMYMH